MVSDSDKTKVWKSVLDTIKVSVSPAIYSTWFTGTSLAKLEKGKTRISAEVSCTSSFVRTTIESRYFGLIQDALIAALGKPCDLAFSVDTSPTPGKATPTQAVPLFDKEPEREGTVVALKNARVSLSYTFENFAVSSSNQMAWAAAEAVRDNPSTAYNPLFIWGGVGVGKTHLANAVVHDLITANPNFHALCCTGEYFTNDIVDGIRNKTTQNFRQKYRTLDILLVDDIQFIAGKNSVQEEFFHTFNALVRGGGQIILTSDRPPGEIARLEERLQSRFEAGLIVDISPPDFELRCAILQIKSAEMKLDLDQDIIRLIAGNIESARQIQGFVVRLSSEAKLRKMEVNPELVQSLLGKGKQLEKQIRSTPEDVIKNVTKYFSLGKRSLLGNSRARPVARPRQILMYLLRTQLNLPLTEVGRLVGGRDHTTVMHAVDKIATLASSDVQIREDIRGIKQLL